LSPFTQALPNAIVYENSALVNVYTLGPALSQPTPFLSKWAMPDNAPYAKWDRPTVVAGFAGPVVATVALQTPALMTLKNDRPLFIRENDPSHSHLSRILAVRLDGSQRQQEFRALSANFVTAVSTLTCLADPADRSPASKTEAAANRTESAAPLWLSDIRSAWQANLAAVTNLNLIKAKGAAGLAGPSGDGLRAGNGVMWPANGSVTPAASAPAELIWDGTTLRLISDCSGTGIRWTDS
jgi:hypothetical protein